MWATVAKYAIKFGVWCLKNPQLVDNGFSEVENIVSQIKAAKTAKQNAK